MEACPIALGCDSRHSHLDGCFSLPACRHLKETFNDKTHVIPKLDFTGDPLQADWISNYHHIAPYAKVDPRQRKLLLHVRRDMVKTQSGGGFGATVSTTRWNKYGTFTAKIRSGSTGPGIVTAFLLSNPALGEEISFELTGKDPKKVITNYYRRIPASPAATVRGPLQASRQANIIPHSHPHVHSRLESHEEIHDLKRDSTTHDLVYKIEWNEKQIRWTVDGKVLRTVLAKDIASEGGLPENAMQLQLTIWDAGHTLETTTWAGGMTEYGLDNLIEYVATVSSVQITCHDVKEGKKPWPGPEATKRLKLARAHEAKLAKMIAHSETGGLLARLKRFIENAILSLIKWACLVLAIICATAYVTPTHDKAEAATKAPAPAPAPVPAPATTEAPSITTESKKDTHARM
ncbi:hypothetical protein BGX34_003377 [Mortierella sp. NVP85]|nr:hypothetical protein BGX34_003377 [Mortierella sp. NVP85]